MVVRHLVDYATFIALRARRQAYRIAADFLYPHVEERPPARVQRAQDPLDRIINPPSESAMSWRQWSRSRELETSRDHASAARKLLLLLFINMVILLIAAFLVWLIRVNSR